MTTKKKGDVSIIVTSTNGLRAIATVHIGAMSSGTVDSYSFENNLKNNSASGKDAVFIKSLDTNFNYVTGDGAGSYKKGKKGMGLYLNGSGGLLLNTGWTSDNYTVSFWVKPEQFTNYTATFFGGRLYNGYYRWVSVPLI